MNRTIGIVAILVILFGCVEEIPETGCCLREGTELVHGAYCQVYYPLQAVNGGDYDEIYGTNYTYSEVISCDLQTGCNVSTADGYEIIPVCSQDIEEPCINGNCTAMVCGEFAFDPTPAPGYEDPAEDAEGDPPADSGSATLNFYKASCEFIPYDEDFPAIMKTSKGMLNVFRMGAGGSFDEFDQYRYMLPISDKYCALTSSLNGETSVDRYMNYLNPSTYAAFDNPVEDIETNCLEDDDAPEPLSYDETNVPALDSIFYVLDPDGSVNDATPVPDISNYKFRRYLRLDSYSSWDDTLCGDDYGGTYEYVGYEFELFKKIDSGFYKKYLTIAYADDIFGENAGDRAPFECRVDRLECYSGQCSNTVYNRGTMIKLIGDEEEETEVATDCIKTEDENGLVRVVCYPTTGITSNGAGNMPDMYYGEVNVGIDYIEVDGDTYYDTDGDILDDMDFDDIKETSFDDWWYSFSASSLPVFHQIDTTWTSSVSMVYSPEDIEFPYVPYYECYYSSESACEDDHSSDTCNNEVYCPSFDESSIGPPIGGAVFFGKFEDGSETIKYGDNDIVGYALVNPDDFEDMLLVDQCELDMTPIAPTNKEDVDECAMQYYKSCGSPGSSVYDACYDWCSGTTTTTPCTLLSDIDHIYETDDFIRVDLYGITDPSWQYLMDAFQPYLKERAMAIKDKGVAECPEEVIPADIVLSSIPWIISYDLVKVEDGNWEDGGGTVNSSYTISTLSSTAAQVFRKRNIFDENMIDIDGTDACTLEQNEYELLDLAYDYNNPDGWYGPRPAYYITYSEQVYLFKHNEETEKFGICEIDDEWMPTVREIGWCEPCTTSTLAYQSVRTNGNVYLPRGSWDVETYDYETICMMNYDTNFWHNLFCAEDEDYATCYNEDITDMGDYDGLTPGLIGSPRTVPEASIMKERLGNYMKSGIMPVLDLTDESNWDLTNDQYFEPKWWQLLADSPPEEYLEYDFEGLIGSMGAAVIIVDTMDGTSHKTDSELRNFARGVNNRASLVKERCSYCLVAYQINDPDSPESFETVIDEIYQQQTGLIANLDLITFSYDVAANAHSTNASKIIEDLQEYSLASMQYYPANKPTMVVGFDATNGGYWDDSNYETLLDEIALQQSDLVKAGIIGIIFSPIRTDSHDGFVTVTSTGLSEVSNAPDPVTEVGTKDEKFCALQSAFQLMSSVSPDAVMETVYAEDSVECSICTGIEIAAGLCGDLICDDGSECNLPTEGMELSRGIPRLMPSAENYRCPEGSVTDDGCELCNETTGYYICTKTYQNGSVDNSLHGWLSAISSDMYMEVMAGIDRPDKCCLGSVDEEGNVIKYTFAKTALMTPLNVPLVFSKAGNMDIDCGFDSGIDELESNEFCGTTIIPIINYDINCTIYTLEAIPIGP